MDAVKEDMQMLGVAEEVARVRYWCWVTLTGGLSSKNTHRLGGCAECCFIYSYRGYLQGKGLFTVIG